MVWEKTGKYSEKKSIFYCLFLRRNTCTIEFFKNGFVAFNINSFIMAISKKIAIEEIE